MNQQQRDDSVLVSLRGLMAMEDERLQREEADRRRAASEAAERAAEAVQRAEAERAAEVQAKREADEARAEKRRDEARHAEVEREARALQVRLAAEASERERALQARLAHERALAEVAERASAQGRTRNAVFAVSAAAVVLCAGAWFGAVRPAMQRQADEAMRAERAAQSARAEVTAATLRADVERSRAAEAEARAATLRNAPPTTVATITTAAPSHPVSRTHATVTRRTHTAVGIDIDNGEVDLGRGL